MSLSRRSIINHKNLSNGLSHRPIPIPIISRFSSGCCRLPGDDRRQVADKHRTAPPESSQDTRLSRHWYDRTFSGLGCLQTGISWRLWTQSDLSLRSKWLCRRSPHTQKRTGNCFLALGRSLIGSYF